MSLGFAKSQIADGPTGPSGPTGPQGTTGATGPAGSGGLINMQTFLASGTWTRPAGTTKVIVEVQAGGGGGGGAHVFNGVPLASGGGGGGYARKLVSSPGATETVTVGAAGAKGGAGGSGGTGGTSSFGAHCSASGGLGGTSYGSATPGQGGVGGTGTGGDVNVSGAKGGYCTKYQISSGVNAHKSGFGGGSHFGPGGPDIMGSGDGIGQNASNYGGGGGGAIDLNSWGGLADQGGLGGAGVVIVYSYS